jgi:hypothetical protein
MPSHAERRRQRLSEFRDARQEWLETRDPEAAARMHRAMASKDTTAEDTMHALAEIDGHEEDRRKRGDRLMKKYGFSPDDWKPEEPQDE